MAIVTCEHGTCATEHDHEQSHSMWACLQKVTPAGYTFFQCEEAQEYNYVNYQHFHCCHTHMLAGMLACVSTHYHEAQLHPAPSSEINILHKMVLGRGGVCAECRAPLAGQAYRFCLTQGLPYHRSDGSEWDHTLSWCCSLEHAQAQVASVIKNIPEMRM